MKQNNPLRCVVIENVEGEANFLVKKLGAFPDVKFCGIAAEVGEAFRLIVHEKPHFMFLDMDIIGGSGFTVLDKLAAADVPIPYIIVTSAFENFEHERQNRYADCFVRYFEKPFFDSSFAEKLEEAVHAVWSKTRAFGRSNFNSTEKKSLFLNLPGGIVRRIDPMQIICLYVKGRDLTVHTTAGKFEFRASLNRFLMSADLPFLVRISSNEAVNLHKIIEVRQPEWRVKMEDFQREPIVSDIYRKDFLEEMAVLSVA